MAEQIFELFKKVPPRRVIVAGKGRSLDVLIDQMDAGAWRDWCIVAINDAVKALPWSTYFVWQDIRYQQFACPPGCQPIRQALDISRFNRDGGPFKEQGYVWTNGFGWADTFRDFRKCRDIRGGLGVLGEWTTGKAIAIVGEWLKRHDRTAELLIVGCDSYDDASATATAGSLPDGQEPAPTYAKSAEMIGQALQCYMDRFEPLRWLHRELLEVAHG